MTETPGSDFADRHPDPALARPAVTRQPEPVAPGRRLKVLAGAVLGSVLSGYLLMVIVAALAGLTVGAPLAPTGLLAAGVPLWLAAHQVPLTLGGVPLGVLPLVPTVVVMALTGNFAAAAVSKLGRSWGGDAAWVAAILIGAHASIAVLLTALPTDPVRAEPWQAFLGGALVSASGAGAGLLREVGAPARWAGAPHWLRTGLAAAAAGAAALTTAAALMLCVALVDAVGAVHDGFAARPGLGVGIGVTALTVCYLPNALVGAVSWLAGPGVVIGAAAASPLSASVGPLPPIPLLAAMPTSQPPGWAATVFVLPVAAGVLVGLGCRRAERDPVDRLRAVAVAAMVVVAGFWVLASVVSGRLAAGPFDPVELPAWSGALALLGWLGVPGIVTVLLPPSTRFRRRRTVRWAEADEEMGSQS